VTHSENIAIQAEILDNGHGIAQKPIYAKIEYSRIIIEPAVCFAPAQDALQHDVSRSIEK
jgi:hypothetical protein